MNDLIINILIYCIPTFGAIHIVITLISKSILKKNGYKVTFIFGMTLLDVQNMNKLSKENNVFRVLYNIMVISSICVLFLFLFFLFIIIKDYISRS